MSEDKQQIHDQKEVAFYSAVVNAWVQTRMERDRSLLALSSGGIGLLVTLLTTVGIVDAWQLVLYIFAASAFATAILSAILIFGRNAEHLRRLATTDECSDDPSLIRLDTLLLVGFVVGMILLAVIGITTACIQLTSLGG